MNGHIRNTENKYLTISLAYISLVAVVSSVILRNMIITAATDINYQIVYGLIMLIGWCVIVLQRWYIVWKKHYLIRCQAIDREITKLCKHSDECYFASVDTTRLKPCWLYNTKSDNNKLLSLFSADNIINILTNVINAGVVFKLSYDFFLLSKYNLLVDLVLVYSLSLFIIYKIITEKKLSSVDKTRH